jgi:SPP1 family predicted phage head-tail adaptor
VPISAGSLDRLISIERRTDTRDSHGQPIPAWSRVGRRRWARYRPMWGTEVFASEQFISRQQIEFLVRWSKDLADLGPLDRVVYPAKTSPSNSEIYDIMGVHEEGRREGLRILTARRSE